MVNINPIVKEIYKKIKKYDEIVIARHIGPDPDAVASEIALRDSIKLTFPKKKVMAIGVGVSRFRYLGNLDKLEVEDISKALLIILDLPNVVRLDGVISTDFKDIIKIDHHPFEEKCGETEWIDETSSSTAEMIAELILNTKLKLNDKIAQNLYLGVASDSERFLFLPNPNKTFLVMHELLRERPLHLEELYNLLYERPFNEIKFQGFIAMNLNVSDNGFAYLKINEEDIKNYNVDAATASNLVNSFNYIKELLVWVFITYDKLNELFKINIRSRGPVINEIAAKYNGGGHKMASGCRIKTETEVNNLLQELSNACTKYKEQEENENNQI